jgi:hypothetical protein
MQATLPTDTYGNEQKAVEQLIRSRKQIQQEL